MLNSLPVATEDQYPVEPGDFISIPKWKTFGMVVSVEDCHYGPEGTIRVKLQEDPNSDRVRFYNLPPGTYEIE